jgi:haloalkane dehalogenase
VVRVLARWVVERSDPLDRTPFLWQVGRFVSARQDRISFVRDLYTDFRSSRPAFFSLNTDLLRTVVSRRKRFPQLRTSPRPVRIVFGAADPYLNPGLAKAFHRLFPTSELFLLPESRHYVQIDAPDQVARLILSTPTGSDRHRNDDT